MLKQNIIIYFLMAGFFILPKLALSNTCEHALTPYRAEYTSSYNGIDLKGIRQLKQQIDGSFLLSNTVKKLGSSVSEQSVFALIGNQVKVKQYDLKQSVLGIGREYHTSYDWQKGIAQVTGRAEVTLSLETEPLDNLSYQLALRCDLEQGMQTLSYPIISKKKLKQYNFKIIGEAHLKTKVGELDTIVLERIRKKNKRTTQIWIAPSLNYMVVKLEQFEKKDNASYRLDLNKVSFN